MSSRHLPKSRSDRGVWRAADEENPRRKDEKNTREEMVAMVAAMAEDGTRGSFTRGMEFEKLVGAVKGEEEESREREQVGNGVTNEGL